MRRHRGRADAGVTLEPLGVILYPPVWVVVVLTCAVGALVGLTNGILIAYFKVPAFVATLGLLYVARGIALLMTNGLTYNNLGGRAELGNTGFDWLGFNRVLNVPIGVVILVAVAILASVLLNRTAFGRWVYSTGGNQRAAELSGVPVKRVTIAVYVLSGISAAIAGLVLSSQLTSAGPTAGTTYELTAIAAVVIGGAALTGGRGNIRGTMLGAFVIASSPTARHHRRVGLLADRLHRRGHRARRAPELHPVRPARAQARQGGRHLFAIEGMTPPRRQASPGTGTHQGSETTMRMTRTLLSATAAAVMTIFAAPAFADGSISIIVNDPSNPYWFTEGEVAKAEAEKLGYTATVAAHKGDTNAESRLIDTAITSQAKAIILDPANADGSVGAVKKAVDAGIPVILVNAEINQEGLAKAQLVSNNAQARRSAPRPGSRRSATRASMSSSSAPPPTTTPRPAPTASRPC